MGNDNIYLVFSCRAKLILWNTDIFVFLNTAKMQVFEIFPHGTQGPAYLT